MAELESNPIWKRFWNSLSSTVCKRKKNICWNNIFDKHEVIKNGSEIILKPEVREGNVDLYLGCLKLFPERYQGERVRGVYPGTKSENRGTCTSCMNLNRRESKNSYCFPYMVEPFNCYWRNNLHLWIGFFLNQCSVLGSQWQVSLTETVKKKRVNHCTQSYNVKLV